MKRRGPPVSIATATSLLALFACNPATEIVLVIDTDMAVPTDIDAVHITLTGATESKDRRVPLSGADAIAFPLTLGLTPGGSSPSVTIAADGLSQSQTVVTQTVRTAFVDGAQKIVRILLLTSCLLVTCPAEQTCEQGVCGSVDRDPAVLPPWTGTVPPRPERPAPTSIAGRSVWASGGHSCGIEGTTLYAWGQNSDGQLGTGNTTNAISRRPVMNVQGPTAVGLGQLHSCVCDKSKQAWCWGRNAAGQLGTGNVTPTLVAVKVPGVADCEEIAGGAAHTCVLHTDKTVSCWGQNTMGQLGQAAGTAPVVTPQQVPGLTDVLDVQCGETYTCALKTDGTVVCWGENKSGQLGDGTVVSRATPAPVIGLTGIVEIAIGRFFSCARRSGGTVVCWGQNDIGQLGFVTPAIGSMPADIVGITDAQQITTGHQHACVIHKTTGLLSCWGDNQFGQLGDGDSTKVKSLTPVDVADLTQVTSVAAGSEYTCARYSMSRVGCWGQNNVNQLGDGSVTNRNRPVTVAGFSGP